MASKQQQNTSSLYLSLKQKLKFICCNFCEDDDDEIEVVQKVLEHSSNNASSLSSLISWLKSEFPELKNFFNGKHHHQLRRNRRVNSSEFRYDPLSYALNFEDDDSHLDEFPLRNFSARLPPSPKNNQNAVVF